MIRKSIYRSMTIFCILAVILMISCAHLYSNVVTVLSEHTEIPNRKIVIIDAGHGGEDGGAVSCTGIPESKTNLEISIKLQNILQLLGIKTIMITGDNLDNAKASAKKIDLLDEKSICVDGEMLENMSESEFDEKFQNIVVYSGISAEQRMILHEYR